MKCPHCNTIVLKIPANWKCPHCKEQLPDPGRWFYFVDGTVRYLQDKGAIFWGGVFTLLLLVIGTAEFLLGNGDLLGYIGGNLLFSIAFISYAGMIISMYFKIVLPLKLPYGQEYVLNERLVIRNIRKGTHFAAALGLLASFIFLKPKMFIWYFPSFLVVIGWFLAMGWSLTGLLLNPKWLEDARFRWYLDERLGIVSLKKWRKLGTIFIAELFLSVVGYFLLLQVPDLWGKIQNTAIVGSMIMLFKDYFGWLL